MTLASPYDIVAVLSLFNAPGSPFEHDPVLCDRLIDDFKMLLKPDGILIVTLRDDLFTHGSSVRAGEYAASKGFRVLHLDGNCAWLAHA